MEVVVVEYLRVTSIFRSCWKEMKHERFSVLSLSLSLSLSHLPSTECAKSDALFLVWRDGVQCGICIGFFFPSVFGFAFLYLVRDGWLFYDDTAWPRHGCMDRGVCVWHRGVVGRGMDAARGGYGAVVRDDVTS